MADYRKLLEELSRRLNLAELAVREVQVLVGQAFEELEAAEDASHVGAALEARTQEAVGGGNVVQLRPKPRVEEDRRTLPLFREEPTPVQEEPVSKKPTLEQKQDRLVRIIDADIASWRESLDMMGCKGDCYLCPHPEYSSVEEQVDACLEAAESDVKVSEESS